MKFNILHIRATSSARPSTAQVTDKFHATTSLKFSHPPGPICAFPNKSHWGFLNAFFHLCFR
jgi:hypothetical protein